MKTENIKNNSCFQARIVISKIRLEKTIGKQNLGFSTVCSGSASSITGSGLGVDGFAHQNSINVPDLVYAKGLFNTLRELGHNILNTFMKDYTHNSYDDTFFSGASSASATYSSRIGRDYLKKSFEEYTRIFPT